MLERAGAAAVLRSGPAAVVPSTGGRASLVRERLHARSASPAVLDTSIALSLILGLALAGALVFALR